MKLELEKFNFKGINIKPMGSLFAVIYDLIHVGLVDSSKNKQAFRNRFIRKFILKASSKIFLYLDSKYMYKSNKITTGYYIEASK